MIITKLTSNEVYKPHPAKRQHKITNTCSGNYLSTCGTVINAINIIQTIE